jgi:hypothetical protein
MSGIVLRGDWLELHRKQSRVWLRERPYEFFWRTSADFTVDEIRSMEILPLRLELNRRRRAPARRGATRVVRPAITRVVIRRDADEPLSVELKETEATVVATFADLGDRVSAPSLATIDLVAEHAADAARDSEDAPAHISWHPGPEATEAAVAPARTGRRGTPQRDPDDLVEVAEHLGRDLARDVSFKLELGADPEAIERWLERQAHPSADPWGASADGPGLFPDDDTAKHLGVWVRKRRRKGIRRRSSGQ